MNTLSKFRSFFLWEGILYTLLGLLMLIIPFPSSLVIELITGVSILIAGIIQTIESFELYQVDVVTLPFLLAGVLAIIIGTLLIFYPFEGVKVITAFIVFYFGIKAILEFIAAISLNIGRFSWWLIANSLILSVLVIYIWKNWSIISLMLLGLLVGINLLSSGITRIMLATKGANLFEKVI